MAKITVRLNADERAICRVRYSELSKTMDIGSTSRSTDGICKAIAAYWKDGSLETGSEYSALLFPFGNPRAVHRHIKEAHVDKADRAIAETWVKKQPASRQAGIRELLGLEVGGLEREGEEEGTSDPESDVKVSPTRSSKRKATKEILEKSNPAAKRRRKEQKAEDSDEEVKSETDVDEEIKVPVKAGRRMGKHGNAAVKSEE